MYSWGYGPEGQLGHGEDVIFLNTPRRLRSPELSGQVASIACGDNFSAAITGTVNQQNLACGKI